MFCDYTAGLIAGFVSIFIGHPLDTIKTQQQLRGISFSEAAKRIKRHRGWRGYYRGLSAPLFANGALNAVFFGVYGDLRDYLVESRIESSDYWKRQHDRLESSQRDALKHTIDLEKIQNIKQATFRDLFISGSIAGLVTIAIAGPIELVKTKLQSQMKRTQFKGPVDCVFTILRDAGIKGLFRGLGPLILRDGPGSGAYMVTYVYLKDYLENKGFTSHGSDSIIAGGCAGIVNWAIVLPFDTIKTRMQGDDHVKPHYRNMLHVAKEIRRTDGIKGLYRGFWSVSARAFPVNASIFLVYEIIQDKICKRK